MVVPLAGCGSNRSSDLGERARFEKPAGWTWTAATTEGEHPVAIGPGMIRRDLEREDEVHPNINLREVSFDGGPERMPDWIKRNLEFTTNTFNITTTHTTTAGELTAFETDGGTEGWRVVLENNRFHRRLVHIQYYFLVEKTVYILTFTRPAANPEKDKELDQLADQTARSFR